MFYIMLIDGRLLLSFLERWKKKTKTKKKEKKGNFSLCLQVNFGQYSNQRKITLTLGL